MPNFYFSLLPIFIYSSQVIQFLIIVTKLFVPIADLLSLAVKEHYLQLFND